MSTHSVITQRRNAQKGIIDTTAPFDSVRTAVHRFGGSVDWKANRTLSFQKNPHVQTELEKVQDELPKYKKQSEDAVAAKAKVLKELDNTKKLMEELQNRLEKMESAEVANAEDKVDETEKGMTEELKTMKEKLATLQGDYHRLVTEKDFAITKAEEAISACKVAEERAEELTIELLTTKGNFKTEELPIKDLRSKFEIATALLLKMKTQLAAAQSSKKEEGDIGGVNASIRKAEDEVSTLKEEASSLKAELGLMKLEAELVMRQETVPKLLEEATEELRKAKEAAEEAKAKAKIMEARLQAALKEIEIAKISEELVLRAVKESGETPSTELEEYYNLRKRVNEAEELSNEKIIIVVEEIKEAKNGESENLEKLEEAEKELERQKEGLKEAMEEVEKADGGKLMAEKELKELEKGNDESRASDERREEELLSRENSLCISSKSQLNVSEMKTKKKKKKFFPRVVMFFAKKKTNSVM